MQKKFHLMILKRILRAIEVKVSTGKIFSDWHKKEKKKFLKKSFILFCEWIENLFYKKINNRCKEMFNGVVRGS